MLLYYLYPRSTCVCIYENASPIWESFVKVKRFEKSEKDRLLKNPTTEQNDGLEWLFLAIRTIQV